MNEMLPCYKYDIDIVKDELEHIATNLFLVCEALEKSGEQPQMFIGRQLGIIHESVETAQSELRDILSNANINREQYDIVKVRPSTCKERKE